MKSEPCTSECSLSFASETTKAATSAPRHLLINRRNRLLRRFLCQQSQWMFWSSFFQPFFPEFLEDGHSRLVGMLRYVNRLSARTSASAQEQSTPFCGFGANTGLCFHTEMVPLDGGSIVGQLGKFISFKLMWICCSLFVLDPGKAANAECFLPSLHPGTNLVLKLRENVEISSVSLTRAPCRHVSSLLSDESWQLSSELFLELFLRAHSLPSLFLFPAVLLFSVSCKGSAMDRVTVVFLLSFTWKF